MVALAANKIEWMHLIQLEHSLQNCYFLVEKFYSGRQIADRDDKNGPRTWCCGSVLNHGSNSENATAARANSLQSLQNVCFGCEWIWADEPYPASAQTEEFILVSINVLLHINTCEVVGIMTNTNAKAAVCLPLAWQTVATRPSSFCVRFQGSHLIIRGADILLIFTNVRIVCKLNTFRLRYF